MSLKFIRKGMIIKNKPAFLQKMTWRRTTHYLNQLTDAYMRHPASLFEVSPCLQCVTQKCEDQ